MDSIRVGKISSLNYEKGAARVTYEDRDNSVTLEMPLFSTEYRMPKVGDLVAVLHMPNGSTAGFVLGRYWCAANLPPESGAGIWRKDVSDTEGACWFKWDDGDGKLTIHVDGDAAVEVTGDLEVTAAGGDVVVDGVSLTQHTHTGVHGETSGPH